MAMRGKKYLATSGGFWESRRVTETTTNEVRKGLKVRICNKYGDEIAEGTVTEIERDGFTLDSGEAVLFRHVAHFDGTTFNLLVVS